MARLYFRRDLSEVGMATLNAGIGDGTNALPRYRPFFVPGVKIAVMVSSSIGVSVGVRARVDVKIMLVVVAYSGT